MLPLTPHHGLPCLRLKTINVLLAYFRWMTPLLCHQKKQMTKPCGHRAGGLAGGAPMRAPFGKHCPHIACRLFDSRFGGCRRPRCQRGGARTNFKCTSVVGGYPARELVVRINALSTPWGKDDIAAFAALEETARPHALLAPKISTPEDIQALAVKR